MIRPEKYYIVTISAMASKQLIGSNPTIKLPLEVIEKPSFVIWTTCYPSRKVLHSNHKCNGQLCALSRKVLHCVPSPMVGHSQNQCSVLCPEKCYIVIRLLWWDIVTHKGLYLINFPVSIKMGHCYCLSFGKPISQKIELPVTRFEH